MKKILSLFLCLAMILSVMSFAAAEDLTLNVMLPDERMRRVGQSVAAASLPEIR